MEKFENIKWKYHKDAYKDDSYETNFRGLPNNPVYAELRVYPAQKGWVARVLYNKGFDWVRGLTLKKGTHEETSKYIKALSKDEDRSSKLIKKLVEKLYFKGRVIDKITSESIIFKSR